MQLPKILSREFDGLSIKYTIGDRKEAIVVARGLGDPKIEEDERWIEIFNLLGYTILIPHYGGTYDSRYGERKFLPASDQISVEKDITDVVNALANEKIEDIPSHKEIILIGDSFGGAVALIVGAKSDYVKKIVPIGGGICSPGKTYRDRAEKMFYTVDKDRNNPNKLWGRDGENYLGFDLEFALGILEGRPTSPYDYLEELAKKDILLLHVKGDRHLSSRRSIDFSKEMEKYCKEKRISSRVKLEIVNDIKNPKGKNIVANHGTIEATVGFYRKLFQFLDPEIDMNRVAQVVREVNSNSKYKLSEPVKKCYGLLG